VVVSDELLRWVRSPVGGASLSRAGAELLDQVKRAVASGRVKNRGGRIVARAPDDGLVEDDGGHLFPVHDDIPCLLADEAIPLDQLQD